MKNFKRVSVLALVLVLASFLFAGCSNRSKIDSFFKSYEKFIEAYAEAVESNDDDALEKLDDEAVKLEAEAEEVASFEEWTDEDSTRFIEMQIELIGIGLGSVDFDL